MLLSRLVRAQLVMFAVLSVIGLTLMLTVYVRLPALLGVGTHTVYLELPESGGLYRFGNVTYRGVQVGKVTAVELTATGVRATMTVDAGRPIPADLEAQVRSVSAVGEQYVDLRPRTDAGPYLRDGSVITAADATVPQQVGPMLDRLSALVGTIPVERLHDLLDRLFQGVNGAGPELDSLLASAATITKSLNSVSDSTATLITDSVPLLDAQARTTDAIQVWTRSLAGVTGQLVADDPQVRSLLQTGPGFANEVGALFESVELTLPVLLANLTSIGQLAVTYNAGLEQILVLLPPSISMIQAVQPSRNASGLGLGDFRFGNLSDPVTCTVGFLPPALWRSPEDTETIDTPDGMYCKLPQDSDIAVRGARNIPCAARPGKRAATAALCNSDEEYVPLATTQPETGPYPRDPGLEEQGVPSDTRPVPQPGDRPANAVPSRIGAGLAEYDPRTGNYVGPDGKLYRQGDLAEPPAGQWQRLLPTG
ncbi:MCE family protein [Nocardia sp. NPDC058480]|uniref:MCE family protein n=1 Tax=unclassified Nocardia TaxID=2637762 RepID=UPI0036650A40